MHLKKQLCIYLDFYLDFPQEVTQSGFHYYNITILNLKAADDSNMKQINNTILRMLSITEC